jgi:hypothetical protein
MKHGSPFLLTIENSPVTLFLSAQSAALNDEQIAEKFKLRKEVLRNAILAQ